ncbi:MAG: YggS family pyridoxal phosphate-dependent enzyme [Nitrospinae bacterium]|nr:YggS family pyridoxal phosphate-dependent enzyme [Nitrospinota bacterium]
MSKTVSDVGRRYEMVKRRVADVAYACGRNPDEIRLLAVSKTQPPERIIEAIEAGVDIIGENRVQEVQRKKGEIDPEIAGRAKWHLIGSLQRNKARAVPGLFDVVESVDSLALARELNRRMDGAGEDPLDVFIQVNTGEEAQKGGVAPADAMTLVREMSALEALRVVGLMCIPPLGRDAEESRPHFEQLRKLRDEAQEVGFSHIRELSMGMSNDFEIAIAEGATLVRIGTAIFGPRGTN